MKLYEWCNDCTSLPQPVKVFVGDARSEATLHLTKDSLLWKTDTLGGISLSSVKMVEAEDENTLSIGYASGAKIESVRIQLLDTEQLDWNKPLLKWYLHLVQGDVLTTSTMKVFQQYYLAFKKEIENSFNIAYLENRSVKSNLAGNQWHKPVHMLNQLLEKEYPLLLKYHPKDDAYARSPQRIHLVDFPNFPYQTQMNCAKLYYLIFMMRMAGAKDFLINSYQGTLYDDSEGMTADDYEKLFMHFGLTEQPILSEEFKSKLMDRSNVNYLVDANGPCPKDYKQWFTKPPSPLGPRLT